VQAIDVLGRDKGEGQERQGGITVAGRGDGRVEDLRGGGVFGTLQTIKDMGRNSGRSGDVRQRLTQHKKPAPNDNKKDKQKQTQIRN
jgi:hypothetical protein